MIFSSTKKNRSNELTVIAGCSRLGASIALSLSSDYKDTLVIDKNPAAFRKLTSYYTGQTLRGNVTDIKRLEEAEINKASVFIALTDEDDTNITSAQIAKKVFNVPKVMARIYDEDKKPLLDKSGIETICPSILSESLITKFMEKKNEG